MRNYMPDHYSQWRHHDARQTIDDGYADCALCEERFDREDEKVCETCRKHGCRQCIQRCTFEGCMEDVCCECADADGYCPYHAEVAKLADELLNDNARASGQFANAPEFPPPAPS